jgi:hypothetical protein
VPLSMVAVVGLPTDGILLLLAVGDALLLEQACDRMLDTCV